MKTYLFLLRELCLIFSLLLITVLTFCQENDNIQPQVDTALVNTLIGESNFLLITYQAEKVLDKTLDAKAIFEKASVSDTKKLADTYAQVGKAQSHLEKYQEATESFKRAIDLYQKYYGDSYFQVGELLNDLGVVYSNLGEFKTALQYQDKSISFKDK